MRERLVSNCAHSTETRRAAARADAQRERAWRGEPEEAVPPARRGREAVTRAASSARPQSALPRVLVAEFGRERTTEMPGAWTGRLPRARAAW